MIIIIHNRNILNVNKCVIIINLNRSTLMGGQNSLKITYGKSRLLERKKRKRKKKKEKRTLMKSNI